MALEDTLRDITTLFGENAGKIWRTLRTHGPLEGEELVTLTELNERDFHGAIGWLARENKIYNQDDQYILDRTNLTPRVGANAGKVWKVLDIWGAVDFPTIKRLAGISEEEVHAALGWLAREDKIRVDDCQRYTLK